MPVKMTKLERTMALHLARKVGHMLPNGPVAGLFTGVGNSGCPSGDVVLAVHIILEQGRELLYEIARDPALVKAVMRHAD